MRGSAVKCSPCSRNSTPGRVVTAVLKPSSRAMANSRAAAAPGAPIDPPVVIVDHEADRILPGDHRFEREPPQFTEAVGKARRNVDRERRAMLAQDRIGIAQRVAVAVVEGEAGEAPTEIALREP